MKTLVLDCTACAVLPRWKDLVTRRVFPIKPGEYQKTWDLRHELLTDEENAALRASAIEITAERYGRDKLNTQLPVGFDHHMIPHGAIIYEVEWA